MLHNRSEAVILAILEFVGLFVAVYGLWFQYVSNVTVTGIFYCTVWYIFGGISHLLGIVSICLESTEDELKGDSQAVLQFHYLSGWLSVVVGYPLMVTFTWMMLMPAYTMYAQVHVMLAILPLIAFIGQRGDWILTSTQVCIGIVTISHFVACYRVWDIWGMSAGVVMLLNITALSTPTKYHVWAFNSREMFIIGLVVTSVLLNMSIVNLGTPLQKIRAVSLLS